MTTSEEIPRKATSEPVPRGATNVRWRVMLCITLVTTLTYLDRLNLGVATKFILDEFQFSTQRMGWVLSAFVLGYSLFQIPGGWLGDRVGPRNVLAGAIVLWSAFTALVGLAPRIGASLGIGALAAFVVVRFLVGMGEAATSPNGNKIVANWMGAAHRGTGASFTILGVGLGGAITPPLIAWLMQRSGWRTSFYLAGLLGLIVVLVWLAVVTDTPEKNPRVNAAELEKIRSGRTARVDAGPQEPTPWTEILRSVSAWGLFFAYFCQGFPIYFYHTWFFYYLAKVRQLTITETGIWGATPYLAIVALAPLGGIFSDYAVRVLGKRNGRRAAVAVGMISSGALLWVGTHTQGNAAAISLLAIGGGMNMFAASTFWATCIDLTEKFTGSLSGMMNTFGNFGGWLSPIVTAFLATHYGWNAALDCAAVISMASAGFFVVVRADVGIGGENQRLLDHR